MARTRSSLSAVESSRVRDTADKKRRTVRADPPAIVPDRYRAFVFPNHIREQRRLRGLQKLMALGERLPDISYIRLSKIERGEVVARADELRQIARALEVAPTDLLIDLADPAFDIAAWALPFQDGRAISQEEEQFTIQLAAALRVLRNSDATLTIARLDKDFGLPPVILSRLENAHKTLDRWNAATVAAVCRVFGVDDEHALRANVADQYRRGKLDAAIARIVDPADREQRARERNAALSAELASVAKPAGHKAASKTAGKAVARRVPRAVSAAANLPEPARMLTVFGTPLAGGLIAFTRTDAVVEAPRDAGPKAFALRVCRATLGPGLPASSIVVADPDRPVTAGGLAAVRSDDGYRLVTVTFDRWGVTKGYSTTPDLELDLDICAPTDVVAVVAAFFV
ncbi:hypothetical protein WSK_2799 [Novosphingobium sp. Rr 2-17]|uniref:helix-turn-helix domain-containing protein n=1 Tax=Novosphingobium sp. Rr 2-17 TaxID=555793 RepID=UPI0002699554|nr:helix-turn-helix transcriptional regulator [Novosphingobium sp. Rr 2-17]EIZ78751.1 hypothetical protein WSK_2799 [Novosphingobium sp. Rr 2-17]